MCFSGQRGTDSPHDSTGPWGIVSGSFAPKGETPKNREMKEGPTMLLITKDRFSEPTISMKTNKISRVGHDVYEEKLLMLSGNRGEALGLALPSRFGNPGFIPTALWSHGAPLLIPRTSFVSPNELALNSSPQRIPPTAQRQLVVVAALASRSEKGTKII
jgi:hypothetical protein